MSEQFASSQPMNEASSSSDDEILHECTTSVEEVSDFQLAALKFLVRLEDQFHMSQSGVPYVCSKMQELLEHYKKSDEHGSQRVILERLNSERKLRKQLEQHCSFVRPIKTPVGSSFEEDTRPGQENVSKTESYCMVVPLKQSLEQLFKNREVNEMIFPTDDPGKKPGYLCSSLDGEIAMKHAIHKVSNKPLFFQIYTDDCEFVNPLGSHVKVHKMTIVYWSLLNLPPHVRSSLKQIFLVGIAYQTDIKHYGFSTLLEDFFDTILVLESHSGLSLSVGGKEMVIHGTLLNFAGDGLALNLVGGFKESFGFASHPCRNCIISRADMNLLHLECEMPLRNALQHKAVLEQLHCPNLTQKEKATISTQSGVVCRSVLYQIPSFDITSCLPQDTMHNILEGSLDLEMKEMLNFLIEVQKIMTYEDLNERIQKFNYPNCFKDAMPSLIERHHVVDGNLRQSAAQTITLLFVLPFILAPYLDDENIHFKNFLLLCQITNVMLSFEVKISSIAYLKNLIMVHNARYYDLYKNITPKMHFLTHAPTVLTNFGPSRETWTMRYEGRHAFLGQATLNCRNFKNLPYTLAYKFQVRKCVDFEFGDEAAKVLGANTFKYKLGNLVDKRLIKMGLAVGRLLDIASDEKFLQSAVSVTYKNFFFEQNVVVLLEHEPELFPQFALIAAMFVLNDRCVFVLNNLETITFDNMRNAFEVKETNLFHCKVLKELSVQQPFPLFLVHGKRYVVLKFYDHCEFVG
ncbi:uncharacterized protein LOC135934360 [Cloeon dipterum]|uniref:uncharacterized protein LOC135934360 n=1 Tax=Cloeon dipterum TaxID=197152 RepID=UPI00322044C2